MRVRQDMNKEVIRIMLQGLIVLGNMVNMMLIAAGLYLNVSPWWVPLRCYEDTFGPVDRIRHFQPPLMNRTIFETPGNIWRPLVFPSDTPLGQMQDVGFGVWNWGNEAVYEGPLYMKVFALSVTFVLWAPFMAFVIKNANFDGIVEKLPRFIKEPYLLIMPEWLLVLEQLFVAKDEYGRKVSPIVMAHMATFDEETPAAAEDAEQAEKLEAPDFACMNQALAPEAAAGSRRRHHTDSAE